jgi:DNA-binding IclR family transcriptional regulator
MEKRGVVERREGDWTLGLALVELASRVPVTENVASRAKPILDELARGTAETANLSAYAGNDVMYVAKADGGRALRLRSSPGDRLPLYCTAAGKCILSRLPAALRSQYISEAKLSPVAPNTITDPVRLTDELDLVIKQGWAIDDEELEPGLVCYGMPLDLPRYGFSGAVSVSGPSGRMKQAQEEILAALRWAVEALLEALGGSHSEQTTALFGPGRGGFKSSDWHRPGSEVYE